MANITTSKKHKTLHILLVFLISGIAVFSGYFVGHIILGKYFTINKYQNLNAEELRDDISKLNYKNKLPTDFESAICFQIAESVLMNSPSYEMNGYSDIQTSAGVSSKSITKDIKTGNEHYIAFATYSSLIKTARQARFTIGGNIKMYEGSSTDETIENCIWTDKYTEYTWEEYYEYFGKYANRNSTYLISTKTVLQDSGAIKDGALYKFSLELDPVLSTIGYVKQIANNAGLEASSITFNKISITFWLDEDFKLVRHEKFESYTVPYGGLSVTLEITNEGTYNIQ